MMIYDKVMTLMTMMNKHRKTKSNNIAVILRVFNFIFISFKSPKWHTAKYKLTRCLKRSTAVSN